MGHPADILCLPTAGHERHDRPPIGPRRLHWVPIRSLAERHRPRILAHLLSLPDQDRYLRFGYAASDTQLERYAGLIDFAHDEVFGIFNRRLDLIAMAHLAALPGANEAEFGVSVRPAARGRGHGARLFDHSVLHARNRDIDTLVIHALSENTAMLRIARNAGAEVVREGGEALARLRLPADSFQSHLDELVEQGAAEIDYRLKAHARRVAGVIEALGEIKDHLTGSNRGG